MTIRYRTRIVPSLQLGERARMRDYAVIRRQPSAFAAAVGDMANNLVGKKEYLQPQLAQLRGLSPDTVLNGGLAGSIYLQQHLRQHLYTSGLQLVDVANHLLAQLYRDMGLGTISDAAERFTGYLGHLYATNDAATITVLGDVFAWVDGTLVAGSDKPIDRAKAGLVDELYARGNPHALEVFIKQTGPSSDIATGLQQALLPIIAVPNRDFQAIYRVVDDIVTPWQIRTLQNNTGGHYHYGAIDGTTTPRQFIITKELPIHHPTTIILHTDGFTAPSSGVVKTLNDLVPVNPQYGEQTAIQIWLAPDKVS